MNRLTKSQAALLNALDRYELKQATLSDLQRDTGLTIRGCRQIAFALEDRSMIAMEGRKCSLTFAGMQAISESPRFITAAELKVFAQEPDAVAAVRRGGGR